MIIISRRDSSHCRHVRSVRPIDLGDVDHVDIMCVGDQHIGEPNRDPLYMRFISDWANAESNRYVVLDGDIFNAAIVGGKSDVYGETMTVDEAMKVATRWLEGLGQKVIANVCGNHDERIIRSVGIDPVQHASSEAGVLYDGLEAFTTIHVGRASGEARSKGRPVCYDLYVTHGVGGGRSVGAKANNLLRLRDIVTADLYVMGHQHDTLVKPEVLYEWSNDHRAIIERQQLCIVTPGGMRRGGYAVAKAYAPTDMSIPIVRLDGHKKQMTPSLVHME